MQEHKTKLYKHYSDKNVDGMIEVIYNKTNKSYYYH